MFLRKTKNSVPKFTLFKLFFYPTIGYYTINNIRFSMFNKQEIKNTIYSPPTFKAFQSNRK